ncbi:putative lipid II flippase FtsW [Oscillospiraceae bacterium OttesenSCG-928-F05]|nr:putative lipid II flippase FtsW [Oscillospiraceae bacterium OttesenSCG-928-F05]
MAKVKLDKDNRLKIKSPMDMPFLMLVMLVMSIGLIMMFSASYASAYYQTGDSSHWFVRQATFAAIGVVVMLIISRMDYQYFRALSIPSLIVAVIFLILVLFIGRKVNGARRWIYIGEVFNFQPSEIAKIAVILSFSTMISAFGEKMKKFKYGILPFVSILAVISFLMYLEPHISGLILIVAVGGVLMFAGGVHWGWFAALGAAALPVGYFVINSMAHSSARLKIWLDPWSDPLKDGYQTIQSLYAIGSGGLLGVGLGKSRQKHLYVPEPQNDFVFAIVCEELGFIGACLVLCLFALLILRGYWIAINARDRFGSLLVTGIVTLFAIQTFLNVAVVTNLIPVTGISLPFFSYGGTSLVIQLAEMGIVLAVSRQIPAAKAG